jgi:hypothetical protein
MIEHTFFSPGRFKREANEFAWRLLFDEEACRVEYDLASYVTEEGIALNNSLLFYDYIYPSVNLATKTK